MESTTPVQVGTYADLTKVKSFSWDAVQTGFTSFATLPPSAFGGPGILTSGIVLLDASIPPVLGNVPAQLSILIGDENGWAAVTNPAWQADGFLPIPNPTPLVELFINDPANTILAGTIVPNGGLIDAGPFTLDGFVLVPEPSTSLFGLIGFAAILFRRRRRN